ncbi:MAG: hypothetical protein FJX76_07320 [Armatimonadetes bacterium]|nr:hypothetical protein [Armatimonadota bacterium]
MRDGLEGDDSLHVHVLPADPSGQGGAAADAGEGGWVYEIRGVPTWREDDTSEGARISRRVPADHIARWGRVERSPSGRLRVAHWVDAAHAAPCAADH